MGSLEPKRRILLIAPPFYRLMGSHYNGTHLGISYIAAVLKQHGHEASVYNADYSDTSEYSNQRQLFDNYPIYKATLKDLSQPIWQEIKGNIAAFSPDIVGITMMTANYKAARNIAESVKEIDSKIKVVVGGAHPTLDPQGTMNVDVFDYVVRGEGEFSLLELADGQDEEQIKGLSFRKSGKPAHNESRPFIKDLDTLPFPSRDSFLNGTENMDFGHIITGRGCPYYCSYCASPQLWQRTVRYRSIDNVLAELNQIKTVYHTELIHFEDDTFTLNKQRAKKICQAIISKQLGIRWVSETRADCLDKELVALMKEAGCVRIKMGAESGSDRILKQVHKHVTREKIRRAVELAKGQGLPLTIHLMAGFPGETNEDLRQTIEFAKELNADYYSLSVLAPYYGTEIWDEVEKSGRKLDREHWEYFYHQSQDMLLNNNLDPELISEFFALNEWGKGERV